MNSAAILSPIPATSQQRWQQAWPALLLLLAWILFLYFDTVAAMVLTWSRSATFTQDFLVPPIVLWLVWRQRRPIASQTPQPSVVALVFIAGAAFVWLLGDLVAVNAVTQLAFVALLVLSVPAVLGWNVARLIVFPLGFLFFAVPIGEFLIPQLMEWTADFTVLALRLSGVPVYREGLYFVIPSGRWSVVEACSGVRYLIASLTVGTLFAYLNYQSSKRRILFVVVSIIVPIVANWMRAYMIVMLGNLSGNRLAVGVDHVIYGWIFFGIVIGLMFLIGARWAEPEKVADVRDSGAAVQMQTGGIARPWTTTACAAVLLVMPQIALWAIDRNAGADPVPFTVPATLAQDWQVVRPGVADFKPAFQNPAAKFNNSYASQGNAVGLYLGYYRNQTYERKLVSSSNVLVVSQDPYWAQVTSGSRKVAFGDKQLAVRTAELRGTATDPINAERLVVWQLYWINGTLTASDYLAKVYGAYDRLMGRGDDSAVIIVYTRKDQPGDAEAVLESFLSTNYAAINELLLAMRKNK